MAFATSNLALLASVADGGAIIHSSRSGSASVAVPVPVPVPEPEPEPMQQALPDTDMKVNWDLVSQGDGLQHKQQQQHNRRTDPVAFHSGALPLSHTGWRKETAKKPMGVQFRRHCPKKRTIRIFDAAREARAAFAHARPVVLVAHPVSRPPRVRFADTVEPGVPTKVMDGMCPASKATDKVFASFFKRKLTKEPFKYTEIPFVAPIPGWSASFLFSNTSTSTSAAAAARIQSIVIPSPVVPGVRAVLQAIYDVQKDVPGGIPAVPIPELLGTVLRNFEGLHAMLRTTSASEEAAAASEVTEMISEKEAASKEAEPAEAAEDVDTDSDVSLDTEAELSTYTDAYMAAKMRRSEKKRKERRQALFRKNKYRVLEIPVLPQGGGATYKVRASMRPWLERLVMLVRCTVHFFVASQPKF